MTKSRAEMIAEEFVIKHVDYATRESLDTYLKRYKEDPEYYPLAATCDGCDMDTIAVYQSFLAGMKAMYLELEKYAQEIKDAEFPATREQQIIVDKITRDLKKLMGEQDG